MFINCSVKSHRLPEDVRASAVEHNDVYSEIYANVSRSRVTSNYGTRQTYQLINFFCEKDDFLLRKLLALSTQGNLGIQWINYRDREFAKLLLASFSTMLTTVPCIHNSKKDEHNIKSIEVQYIMYLCITFFITK